MRQPRQISAMPRKLCLLCGQFQNTCFHHLHLQLNCFLIFMDFFLKYCNSNFASLEVGGLVLTVGVWVAADKASFVQMTQVSVIH